MMGYVPTMPEVDEADDPLSLAKALISSLDFLRNALPPPPGGLGSRLAEHLGTDPRGLPGAVERLPASERVNVQVALDEMQRERPQWQLIGLQADVGNFGGFSITTLATGRFGGHVSEQPVEYVRLPVSAAETLKCFRAGLVLTVHNGSPVGVLVFNVERGPQVETVVEVVGGSEETASSFLAELRSIMHERNVFRGKVISFSWGVHGEFGLQFAQVPAVTRRDVVLPDADLDAVEQHTIEVSRFAAQLLEAGQHLRRGVLLYGPPGTGKTHTVMYLCNQLVGRTVILLAGPALRAIGQAGTLARTLSPSMIVIEDVDLIGMDRGLPGAEHNPLLFQLLNEMDGIGNDVDVIFMLTTNRVDLLEPALTARPGRVDRAIEIGLPDDEARRRLFKLYLPDEPISTEVVEIAVARTAGAAAAFIKELARRCVLDRLLRQSTLDEALPRALSEMLDHATPVLQRSLGMAPPTPANRSPGP